MQFTLDGTTIITGIVCALWSVAFAACGLWVARVQKDAGRDRDTLTKVVQDLATFRETVAKDYASRDEVKDEREETRSLFARIDAKIDTLTTQILKANKP